MFACAKCLDGIPMRGIFACVAAFLVMLSQLSEARADEAEEGFGAKDAEGDPKPQVFNQGFGRPAPLSPLVPAALPVTRHVDIGAAVALVHRVAEGQTGADASLERYPSAIGWGLSARVNILRYLRGSLHIVRSTGTIDLPVGALGLPGDPEPLSVASYSLGLRLSPTLPLGPRARTWLSAGAGWGRLEIGRFDVASAGKTFLVRERAFSFVEFPVGIGTSIDIIKNWLTVEFEATASFHVAQRGTALQNGQAIDTSGRRIPVKPFPSMAASFVQTLGLALVL